MRSTECQGPGHRAAAPLPRWFQEGFPDLPGLRVTWEQRGPPSPLALGTGPQVILTLLLLKKLGFYSPKCEIRLSSAAQDLGGARGTEGELWGPLRRPARPPGDAAQVAASRPLTHPAATPVRVLG